MSTPRPYEYVQEDQWPHCGCKLECATMVEGEKAKPSEDDITVCIMCTSVLRFGAGLRLRLMDEEEIAALDPNNYLTVARVRAAIRQCPKPGTRNPEPGT